MLAGFVRYLEEAGLAELHVEDSGVGDGIDWAAVDNVIRFQALVLLADRLGLDSPYAGDRYLFGPGSGALAEDVRTLERERARLYDGAPASVPGSFKREAFEGLVRGRDASWLDAASTLVQMSVYRGTRGDLVDAVRDDDLKGREPAYPPEYVSGVLGELERAGIITFHS